MTPELWQRLKPLFHAALETDTDNRAAFVATACGNDMELKRELEQLVKAEAEKTHSLESAFASDVHDLLAIDATRFRPDELVLGRFRILRAIGAGGMGEVYEAEDLQLGVVALKTIRSDFASSPSIFERFRQEVQLARKVSGPQICRIHELYILAEANGHEAGAFLTMEYLEGVTLAEKIRRDGPFPWDEARVIALEICEGLRLIHEKGIIHRDLKSANIMLCEQAGRSAVLMDFGLAYAFHSETPALQTLTSARTPVQPMGYGVSGTPEYMAPEQFEGTHVSPATDIYALGIVLYELVTGIKPYSADTPMVAAIRRARQPPPPSSLRHAVPRQCDRIIDRCLAYEPGKRFQSAQEVARALNSGPLHIENLRRDWPWLLWGAFALVFALLATGLFRFWQSRQIYRPTAEALRWYDTGVAALREGNNVRATRALQQAVASDNHFVMAHARLAEAWNNLDFDGNAEHEMLLATPEGRQLRSLDRMYLDAIRASITKDSTAEVKLYRQILDRLPAAQKSPGYIDLGAAEERAADPTHALESYQRAAALDPDNAASYMHTAVLQSHLHHVADADRAFDRAQTLLSAEMNQEGLAELAYARGSAALDNGEAAEARQILKRSLEEAASIPSVQLQIRILNMLSAATARSDAAEAATYAGQSIHLARENQLEAWAANGLVRLATAQMYQSHFQQAEDSVREAAQLAHETQQLRVEAMANFTLASLMNQVHRPDQVIAPAQSALDYYRKNGYFAQAAGASALLIRTERDKGQYQQALGDGKAFLEMAETSGNLELLNQAEQLVGTVYLAMEQYPDALVHFHKAEALAGAPILKAYGAINTAEVLWRLGRYSESEEALKLPRVNDRVAMTVGLVTTSGLLSRQRYAGALSMVQHILAKYPNMDASVRQEYATDRVIAESHLGMKQKALADMTELEGQKATDAPEKAAFNLVAAEVLLAVGEARQAHDAAIQAATYFETTAQLDSELRSLCIAAQAARKLSTPTEYQALSDRAVDIASTIQHTWSPSVSQSYFSRPDLQALMRAIPVTDRR